MTRGATVLLAATLAVAPAAAQSVRPKPPAVKKPAMPARPALPPRVAAPAVVTCPLVLGTGVGSKLKFCDVAIGRNPADGVLIDIPPHVGVLTLTFDLHNRHLYSEELVRARKAYANYTATIGVLTREGVLLSRAVVRSEFRSARDLLDRIGGGAGPGGLKAVAPIGTERVSIDVPEEVSQVSLLGEKLSVITATGTETISGQQRPIAAVSNASIDYQPPAPKPADKKKTVKK